jgi:hypothetical protein
MKIRNALLPAFVVVLLSSCATTSPVVPIGSGRYEVTGHSATAFGTAGGQKIKLIAIANDYCSKQGKQANVEGEQGEDGHVGSFAQVNGGGVYGSAATPGKFATGDVVFSCQ